MAKAFPIRAYYTIPSRNQEWTLEDWKRFVDCMARDECNLLIYWIGGGFRSVLFPDTWQYNKDNENIKNDFSRELIDYAHTKGIEVILGFSPFCYDGVNQYTSSHPELAAKKSNGEIIDVVGIHSLGRMLCPAIPESQEFMYRYAREMYFDFYPNADGLFIESSDYGNCECPSCREHYFEHEWAFIDRISSEVFAAKPNARMLIYPHYYQKGVAKPDTRFSLFFTPHSTQITDATASLPLDKMYWQMTFGEPLESVRLGALTAFEHKLEGYVASMEAFSYTEKTDEGLQTYHPYDVPWTTGFGFDDLILRVLRYTYRAYAENPLMTDQEYVCWIAKNMLGDESLIQKAEDAITLCSLAQENYKMFVRRGPIIHPEDFDKDYPEDKRSEAVPLYREKLRKIKEIADRNDGEINNIASWILDRWKTVHPEMI